MITRYAIKEVEEICSLQNRYQRWQKLEIAVIVARMKLGLIDKKVGNFIITQLEDHPIDCEWIKKREAEIEHDLNAFLDERLRFLDSGFHQHFHAGMTSYDTEEGAFSLMLLELCSIAKKDIQNLYDTLFKLAFEHQYTLMLAKTHGQEAELQSYGKRLCGYLAELYQLIQKFNDFSESIKQSKISGATGNYSTIDPSIEKEALGTLGLVPFIGATQIIPRSIHDSLAHSIFSMIMFMSKIGLNVRLGARSGYTIFQEPFRKTQKGSSAMPHKKNTIISEQLEGMERLAKGYAHAIEENCITWEERSIEQSSVERVAWSDLFHVFIYSLRKTNFLMNGLVIKKDEMMREIVDSMGCYASNDAKMFLKKHVAKFGLADEDAYRIVQLAAFISHEPWGMKFMNQEKCHNLEEADNLLKRAHEPGHGRVVESIKTIIRMYQLKRSDQLDISLDQVNKWNDALRKIFKGKQNVDDFEKLFTPSYLLRNEHFIFEHITSQKQQKN